MRWGEPMRAWGCCAALLVAAQAACTLTYDFDSVRPREDASVSLEISSLAELYRTERGRTISVPFTITGNPQADILVAVEADDGGTVLGLSAEPVAIKPGSSAGNIELIVDSGAEPGGYDLLLVATAEPDFRSTAAVTLVVSGTPGTNDESFSATLGVSASETPVAVAVAPRAPWTIYVLLNDITGSPPSRIVALDQSGVPVSTFGSAGQVSFEFEGGDLHVDSEGRIAVLGRDKAQSTAHLRRLTSTGVADASFGAGAVAGEVSVTGAVFTRMAIDAAGVFWVIGAQSGEACVWIVDDDGSAVDFICDAAGAEWKDVALQGDGKAVVAGTSETHGYRVRRYQRDALALSVDDTFATSIGGVVAQTGGNQCKAVAVAHGALGPVDSIVVGGQSTTGLLRLWQISKDANEGSDPVIFENSYFAIQDAVSDSLGRLVFATSVCTDVGDSPTCASLVRWSEGEIDLGFGAGGSYQMPELVAPLSLFYAVAVQPDGRLVTAGVSEGQVVIQRVWD